jgi:hypothetical protein
MKLPLTQIITCLSLCRISYSAAHRDAHFAPQSYFRVKSLRNLTIDNNAIIPKSLEYNINVKAPLQCYASWCMWATGIILGFEPGPPDKFENVKRLLFTSLTKNF